MHRGRQHCDHHKDLCFENDSLEKRSFAEKIEFYSKYEKLEYISSAGLRLILSMQDIMSKQGSMTIKNLNKSVREVFDVTGLSGELNIE